MAKRARRLQKVEEAHTELAIRVEHYDARVDGGINHDLLNPQHVWRSDENDPVYKFTSQLRITGTSIYPPKRAGDRYELVISGNDAASQSHHALLKDA